MAGRPIPGHPGVTVYPPGELSKGTYVLKNADGSIFTDQEGNTYAGQEPNALTKAMPYIVGGMFAYGALAPVLAGAGGAAASGSSAVGGSVAGTGAAAAGGVSSWLAPALQYGLPVAAGLAGNVIQAKSNSAAAKLQAELTQRALDDARAQRDIENRRYEDETAYGRQQRVEDIGRQQEVQGYNRQQYADFSQSLAPYRAHGVTASDRLAALLARGRS